MKLIPGTYFHKKNLVGGGEMFKLSTGETLKKNSD